MSESKNIAYLDGMFVGLLDTEEGMIVHDLVRQGRAKIVYEGASGFMGLGKVRFIGEFKNETDSQRSN